MRRLLIAAALVGLTVPQIASAQTSTCSWIGTVWTCNTQRQPQIEWGRLQTPDYAGNAMRAFQQGQEIARQAREAEERQRLQAQLVETQRLIAQQQAQQTQSSQPAPQADYGQAWLTAAQKRAHLFPNFREVVFAPDVPITPQMVMLMSVSPYAADIAYHLGTHKAEALAIAKLPLLEAGKAIDEIEAQVKAKGAASVPSKP